MNKDKSTNYKAFSLLELSVVLVISGLLIAAIMSGTTLIKQSKLRGLIAEVNTIEVAVRTFGIEYDGLPGDITNAQTLWPSCTDVAGNTCNGNGDQIIDDSTGNEDLRTWQHLALAEMYTGDFTGIISGDRYTIGINAPISVIPNGSYQFDDRVGLVYGRNGKLFRFGSVNSSGRLHDQILTALDAKYIDTKMDDGIANKGELYVTRGYVIDGTSGRCVDQPKTVSASTAVNFILTDNQISCTLHFWDKY